MNKWSVKDDGLVLLPGPLLPRYTNPTAWFQLDQLVMSEGG